MKKIHPHALKGLILLLINTCKELESIDKSMDYRISAYQLMLDKINRGELIENEDTFIRFYKEFSPKQISKE